MFTSAENQKDFDVKLPMINYGSFGKSESQGEKKLGPTDF